MFKIIISSKFILLKCQQIYYQKLADSSVFCKYTLTPLKNDFQCLAKRKAENRKAGTIKSTEMSWTFYRSSTPWCH